MGLAGAGGVLVTTLNPILTSTVVFCFIERSVSLKNLIGLTIGFIGGSIIIRFWEMDFDLMIQSGNIFYILASLSWVSVTITSQKAKEDIHFLTYSFWSFAIAAIFSLSVCNWSGISITFNYDWIFWVNILILSVVVMAFANTMYFFASSKIGAVKASSFIFIVPLMTIIFSKIFLNEKIRLTTLIGGCLSIIAVYMINKKNN
jgi:drug/metabolite transporter (DMT)-like permease